jgi:hypothetical protein
MKFHRKSKFIVVSAACLCWFSLSVSAQTAQPCAIATNGKSAWEVITAQRSAGAQKFAVEFSPREVVVEVAATEPLIVADALLVSTSPAFIPQRDITVTKSGFFGRSVEAKFQSGRAYRAIREIVLNDGRVFRMLEHAPDNLISRFLLVSNDGRICETGLDIFHSIPNKPYGWGGDYAVDGVSTGKELSVSRIATPFRSFRLIFDGLEYGMLKFTETWVTDKGAVKSRAVKVDSFSKQLQVGPIVMQNEGLKDGKLTVRYKLDELHFVPAEFCSPTQDCFR